MTDGKPNLQSHLPALDGIRGLAILLVVFYHAAQFPPASVGERVYVTALGVGWSGVILFFVLSGFLITNILDGTKESPRYFRNFYARRVLRIFPLYYAMLAVVVVVSALRPGDAPILRGAQHWYWLYLQNFRMIGWDDYGPSVLSVSWSLAIEEQFYLLWPTVVLLLSRDSLRRLCVGIVLGTLALRGGLLLAGVSAKTIYLLTPTRLDALAVGAWIALSYKSGRFDSLRPWGVRALWGGGAVSLAAFVADGGTHSYGPWTVVAGYSGLSLLFGGLMVLALEAPENARLSRLMSGAVLRHFGKYSYAVYLFHVSGFKLLCNVLWPETGYTIEVLDTLPRILGSRIPALVGFMALGTAVTLVMSWISWYLLEQPFLSLKRYFSTKPPADTQPALQHVG